MLADLEKVMVPELVESYEEDAVYLFNGILST